MKIIVTKKQFKKLLDNPKWLVKGVGLKFTSNLLGKVLSTSKSSGTQGYAFIVNLND